MDKSFQTSFIPKKPLAVGGDYSEDKSLSVLSFIAIILFVTSLLSFGGVFLYKIYLQKQKDGAEKALIASRDSFEPNTISNLELFDKRTTVSKSLLSNHTVLSPFFEILGKLTIPSIQYTNFSINMSDNNTSVSMSGTAHDYKDIALQAQIFNNAGNTYFKNVVFSNLTKNKNISFKISFDVNPTVFSYERSINPVNSDKKPTSNNINTTNTQLNIPKNTNSVNPTSNKTSLPSQ